MSGEPLLDCEAVSKRYRARRAARPEARRDRIALSARRATAAEARRDRIALSRRRAAPREARRELIALEDFSLRLEADEARIVALAGRSGSGKTTALQLALGLLQPTSGAVRYRGTPLSALLRAGRKRFRQDVQAVFDDPFTALNPFYRVGHVFEVMGRTLEIADAWRATADALEFVGLDPARVLSAFPHELSGGERQRVMIARAVLPRPRLIVADEPLSLVDAPLRTAILGLILELRQSGISFLYATHDLSTAYHVADELIVLDEGETIERGPAREVIDAPRHLYTRALVDSVPVLDPR